MPALAMTDHGNVFGAYDFVAKGKAAGVNPIVGMEAYVTPGTARQDRTRVRWAEGGEDDVSGGGAYTHMTLLAKNETGLRNLFRLASLASLEGYFYKPRIDRELLSRFGLRRPIGRRAGVMQREVDDEFARAVASGRVVTAWRALNTFGRLSVGAGLGDGRRVAAGQREKHFDVVVV